MSRVPTTVDNDAPVLPFEQALLIVSDCLVDAYSAVEQGESWRARSLFALAERYAIHCGYLELVRLVWTYADSVNLCVVRSLPCR